MTNEHDEGIAIGKAVTRGLVNVILGIAVAIAATSIYTARTTVEIARIQSSPEARDAAKARAEEQYQAAQRSMFESMKR